MKLQVFHDQDHVTNYRIGVWSKMLQF